MIGWLYDLAFAPLRWALHRAFDAEVQAALDVFEAMTEEEEREEAA